MKATSSVRTQEPAAATPWWSPSDPGFHWVAIPSRPWHKLSAKQVPGELTRFYVESETLWCPACQHRHDAKAAARLRLDAGDVCGRGPLGYSCAGILERYFYTVDLADFNLHGSCTCPHFTGTLVKELEKDHPSTWINLQWRCKHIQAAASLAQLIWIEICFRKEKSLAKK